MRKAEMQAIPFGSFLCATRNMKKLWRASKLNIKLLPLQCRLRKRFAFMQRQAKQRLNEAFL